MSLSLSALERRHPPPRRKSCAACTKAKRRCSNTLPSCARCSQRGLVCHYAGQPPGLTTTSILDPLPTVSAQSVMPLSDLEIDAAPTPSWLDAAWHPWSPFSPPPPPPPLACIAADDSVPPLIGLSVDGLAPADGSPHNRLLPDEGAPVVEAPAASLIRLPSAQLPELETRDFDRIAAVVRSRLAYAIDKIKDAPRLLLAENQLPWSHPMLYRDGMPASMQGALSSCALYVAKNAVNAAVVLSCIHAHLRQLLSAPEPAALPDLLARTQALLLYTIFAAFDPDPTSMRAVLDEVQDALMRSAKSLLSLTNFSSLADGLYPEAPSLYPLAESRAMWEAWVLMESSRRTVMISFFFSQLYRVLVGIPAHACDGMLYINASWTMSPALWQALGPVDFAVAWRRQKYFIVKKADVTAVIKEGRPRDVDEFSRIFLTCMMGIEEFKGWLLSRGGDP
ncbi:Zn(2)-C6 fungal-type DNA-binding domain protein [Niveomyces insectorum RCEF 264]|uniref:Zn(2)-C6 fungal-type DNA-binding domain protein n=1 Tax=Niveomyces insectorum RCEF 264 TaxID=1081102 RepID=A0A167W5M8_9HYPO|nr:Zn(2)-C6 fungal-type DNA-binding domain protein [Niveomyces insectorum RCEF 264]